MRVPAAECAYCRQQEHRSHDFAQSRPSHRIGARRCPGFGRRVGLGHKPQELVGRERQDTEHQMAHHLSMTAHTHVAPAEFILQAPVDTFDRGALVVALLFGGLEIDGIM